MGLIANGSAAGHRLYACGGGVINGMKLPCYSKYLFATQSQYAGVPIGMPANKSVIPAIKPGGVRVSTLTGIGSLSANIRGFGNISFSASGAGRYSSFGFLTASRTFAASGAGSLTARIRAYANAAVKILIGAQPTAEDIAGAVRYNLLVELSRLDASISSRLSQINGNTINLGIQKASKLIPHSTNL